MAPSPTADLRTVLRDALGQESRAERARRACAVIRQLGGYRWVGLYDVTDGEIRVIIAQDTAQDPRSLATRG